MERIYLISDTSAATATWWIIVNYCCHWKCIMEVKNWGKIGKGDPDRHQNLNDWYLVQKFHQNRFITFRDIVHTHRGVVRNLLRGRGGPGGRKSPAGFRSRAPVVVWGQSPRSRRQILISSYNGGHAPMSPPLATPLCTSRHIGGGITKNLYYWVYCNYCHRRVGYKNLGA